jgi:hypothetical protein
MGFTRRAPFCSIFENGGVIITDFKKLKKGGFHGKKMPNGQSCRYLSSSAESAETYPDYAPSELRRVHSPHSSMLSKDQRFQGGAFHMTAGTCQRSPKRGLRVGGSPTKRDGGSARKGGPPLS